MKRTRLSAWACSRHGAHHARTKLFQGRLGRQVSRHAPETPAHKKPHALGEHGVSSRAWPCRTYCKVTRHDRLRRLLSSACIVGHRARPNKRKPPRRNKDTRLSMPLTSSTRLLRHMILTTISHLSNADINDVASYPPTPTIWSPQTRHSLQSCRHWEYNRCPSCVRKIVSVSMKSLSGMPSHLDRGSTSVRRLCVSLLRH